MATDEHSSSRHEDKTRFGALREASSPPTDVAQGFPLRMPIKAIFDGLPSSLVTPQGRFDKAIRLDMVRETKGVGGLTWMRAVRQTAEYLASEVHLVGHRCGQLKVGVMG
ncbi:unnamed protein product [Vitrella brassicaformis CCMP3155]|uniref:Uncharacterized protein n=1 Tax=Vitrella brassicaformis (strain CCMP3155) TaxID=1169540 RepID=A0A0G4EUH3_VITBC|nr:unnamed protein product [Vitrella brassicaformis CCMP3155]|mmetsp:Transcript_51637/g.129702  ORF Transcript_51637/g.129702 Transcript_51637/m.129702 type:complete len:110 (-) Transcript_51637:244-573(-)|eukprot:CEM01945.1 unnamed protein product [Vitrella brassicaformis CCMP3155]